MDTSQRRDRDVSYTDYDGREWNTQSGNFHEMPSHVIIEFMKKLSSKYNTSRYSDTILSLIEDTKSQNDGTVNSFEDEIKLISTYCYELDDPSAKELIKEALRFISDDDTIETIENNNLRLFLKDVFNTPGIFYMLFTERAGETDIYVDTDENLVPDVPGDVSLGDIPDDAITSPVNLDDDIEKSFELMAITSSKRPIKFSMIPRGGYPLTGILPLANATLNICLFDIGLNRSGVWPYDEIDFVYEDDFVDDIDFTRRAARLFISKNCGYIRARLDSIVTPWNISDDDRFQYISYLERKIYFENFKVKKDAFYMFFDRDTYMKFHPVIDNVITLGKYIKKVLVGECVSMVRNLFKGINIVLDADYNQDKDSYSKYITNDGAFTASYDDYMKRHLHNFTDLLDNGAAIREKDGSEVLVIKGRKQIVHDLGVMFCGLNHYGWVTSNYLEFSVFENMLKVLKNFGYKLDEQHIYPVEEEFELVDSGIYSRMAEQSFIIQDPDQAKEGLIAVRKSLISVACLHIKRFINVYGDRSQKEWSEIYKTKPQLEIDETLHELLIKIQNYLWMAYYSMFNQINLYFQDCYLLCRNMWFDLTPCPDKIAEHIFGMHKEEEFLALFSFFARKDYVDMVNTSKKNKEEIRGEPPIHKTVANFHKRGYALIKRGYKIKDRLAHFYGMYYVRDLKKHDFIDYDRRVFHNTEKFQVYSTEETGQDIFLKEDEIYNFLQDKEIGRAHV